MGSWRKDQHKRVRRYNWGQTRGQNEGVRQDFMERIRPYPVFKDLRIEKLGEEIHCWRLAHEEGDQPYWTSCLRFVDDGWGYWTVYYRTDEGRWRATDTKEAPLGRAISEAAEWYSRQRPE
jgi:hypothetical protein